ncbi:hypothetical protein FBUS_04371 [Fasciolopsis buskii]|uniref:STAS domain-containing protein n=1 Tax=Fasciolopsis buskii TaxID=27845 RepID=A0A8E0RSA8_9TREM|nr:hypothetical protein FBUS_04371 [Fasciolopsis buski]
MLDLPKLYRRSLVDLGIWSVSFLATVLVDIPYGLLIGFCYSLITILYRTHSAERCTLGRVHGTNVYLSRKHFDGIDYLPGLTLLQTTGPIYYVNADAFRDWLIYSTGFNPYNQLAKMESTKSDAGTSGRRCSALRSFGKRLMNRGRQRDHRANSSTYEMDEVKKECSASLQWHVERTDSGLSGTLSFGSKFIILDMSGCCFTDSVGADVLIELAGKYRICGIQILLAHCSWHVRKVLLSSGFDSVMLDKFSFPTIDDAVAYAEHNLPDLVKSTQDNNPNKKDPEKLDETLRL